jgi:putative aldouronate transport system permease protein
MVRKQVTQLRRKRTAGDLTFDVVIYLILICLSFITLIPFLQVITISLSPSQEINKYGLHILPTAITLEGYQTLLSKPMIWQSYYNTILRTVLGTLLSVFLTVLGAYPLSKKYLPNRNLWTGLIVFTMYFSGGLIPSYILVRNLGLMNHLGALILPGAVSAFNLIITRNFFMTLPESIEESARIDGAGDIYILFTIIIPLSTAIIATIGLWYAVGHWNAWFDCLLYIKTQKKYVLQLVLRQILLEGQTQDITTESQQSMVSTDTMKMATLVVAIVPIICTYPFLQKYFVKGVMIGSLKG